MKIGLVGWGIETKSAYHYFGKQHQYLIVSEQPIHEPPNGNNVQVQTLNIERSSGDAGSVNDLSYMKNVEKCDLIIYTPIAWNNLVEYCSTKLDVLKKSKTVLELFFEVVDRRKVIGVTGTKGKSTTATLLYEFLKKAGKKVYIGGNVGVSPLDFIEEMQSEDALAVIELSSYQLLNMKVSPHVAILLGITPEHLDWHGSFDAYIEAKSHITAFQNATDHLIYAQTNESATKLASGSTAQKHPFPTEKSLVRLEQADLVFQNGERLVWDELHIKGAHNLLNLEAACIAYQLFVEDISPLIDALKEFKGLPHRLAFVAEHDGAKYYNDSIASAPEASLAGLRTFSPPVVLLIGGHDRGVDLYAFGQSLAGERSHLRHVICFGEVGVKLGEVMSSLDIPHTTVIDGGMKAVVETASLHALPGDVVLLSPGFSSYDAYRKFHERGDDFCRAVTTLSTELEQYD